MHKSKGQADTGLAIRVRYLLGLGIIAVLATASYLTLQQSIEEQAKYARIINLASHQAGLANRIAYFASLMVSSSDENEVVMARSQVKRSLRSIADNHRILSQGDNAAGLPLITNDNLDAIYRGDMLNLDRALSRFIEYANILVEKEQADASAIEYIYLVTYGPHKLEPLFNEAVDEYERTSDAAIAKLQRQELIIWVVTLMMLILELLLIFRPMELRIRRAIASLNDSIHELTGSQNNLMLAKQKAEEASEAKSRFLATMSHELRTPMNGVIGTAELLSHSELDAEQKEHVRTIISSSELLLSVINDVLDFSKLQAGKVKIEKIPFDLETLARDVLVLLKPACLAKQLHLILDYPMDVPIRFDGDPLRIRQIIFNLVGNAIKFTEKGYICLSIRAEQNVKNASHMVLTVEDSGIGIEAHRIPSLFLGFNQGDNSTTRRYGGTGLGLSISSQLVRLMGGEIDVESLYGGGSRFRVTLPLPMLSCDAGIARQDVAGLKLCYLGDDQRSRRVFEGYAEYLQFEFALLTDVDELKTRMSRARREGACDDYLVLDFSRLDAIRDHLEIIAAHADVLQQTRVILHVNQLNGRKLQCEPLVKAGIDYLWLDKPMTPTQFLLVLNPGITAESSPGQAKKSVIEARATASQHALHLPTRRILLVEDVPVNQKVALKMLKHLGIQAELAENGEQAVAMWEQGIYDLILMDCQMPVLDGYSASRIIRSKELTATGIPIIALTANASSEDQQKCLASGMNDVVTKPFKMQTLADALERWLPAAETPADLQRESRSPMHKES